MCRRIAVLAGAWFLLAAASRSGWAAEADALAILANIQARHLPFGTILDPIFASATSNQIVGYTRCGDSAIWTGHYLAAEAFRYKVTQAPDALNNVKSAIAGIQSLANVTGTNLLARCLAPINSPFTAGMESEEAPNGIHLNSSTGEMWVGNTSRDEYMGVIFGLGVAYDMVGDSGVQSSVSQLVTQLIDFLTGHAWTVVMPDGAISTTFLIRPDEILALLQVGRHVNASHFSTTYDVQSLLLAAEVITPILVDVASDDSYFKFNLDYIGFYNLIRLESGNSIYKDAYAVLRNHTAGHQNAFFDVIDRGLNGPNAARDSEALKLLDQWLQRPRRDPFVNLTGVVPVCGAQACQPIPVPLRVPTDFLWQRSPFQLSGGGSSTIEGAGIDYILPYWMARYYQVSSAFAVQSAAAASIAVAPGSIASILGSGLSSQTQQSNLQPPPVSLGGVSVTIQDVTGTTRSAPLMYVSPGQINLVIPDGAAPDAAMFTISNGAATLTADGAIQSVAPTLFSANGTGTGVAAATALRTQAGNAQLLSQVAVFQCNTSGCVSTPIDLGVDTPVYLTLYGTGIRNRSSLSNVIVTINGVSVPVLYAGPQPTYAGLDQVNVVLTLNLRGSGESNIVLSVDGQTANTVTVNIR
jgi:uncharacterized protein (TIGR03437 family)